MAPNIVSIVGKSNSGKTTLLEKLIACLNGRGVGVGTVKHAHDGFEFDKKGKDSWRHQNAGARATLVISDNRVVLVKNESSPPLEAMTQYLQDMDLILVEGFKTAPINKIEIFRKDGPHEHPLGLNDGYLVAMVTDAALETRVPTFGLDDIEPLADFIEKKYLHA